MQNIEETSLPFLVTLNPDHTPKHTLLKWSTGHPVPSIASSKASLEFDQIQGKRGIWFCGAFQGELMGNKHHNGKKHKCGINLRLTTLSQPV